METVYLHGFATTPEIWSSFWKPANKPFGKLRAAPSEVEVLRGFQKDRFPNLKFDNIEREAGKLIKRIGRGRRIKVVGWSMGGMVALQMAVMAPEKIKSLVLVSTSPKFVKSDDFPWAIPLAILKRLEKKIKVEGIKAFHDLIGLSHGGDKNVSFERAESELAELARVDLRPLLPKIKAPTLIIHGDQDEICLPGAAKYMNKEIKNSRLIMLKDVGHAPMFAAPEELKKYVG